MNILKENENQIALKETERALLLYLLKQIKNVCNETNIPYYASGGTCLGAVRHGGIIPWDDDIDLMMHRKYYNIFVNACNSKFEFPVLIRTRENDPWFCGEYIKICFKDDVKGYSDVSIDVFFLDETNPKRKIFRAIQNFLLTSLYYIKLYKISNEKNYNDYIPQNFLKKIFLQVAIKLPYKTIESWHKSIMTAEKKECTHVVNWGSCYSYKKATYSKKALGLPVEHKFENTYIFTPEHHEIILTQLYGKNYMTPPPPEKCVSHAYSQICCSDLDIDKILEEVS